MNFIPDAEQLFGSIYALNGSQTQLIFECPKCPSGKSSKLYVGIETGGFKCWRCGYKGYVQIPHYVKSSAQSSQRKDPMTLDEICTVPVRPGSDSYKYLQSRKLNDEHIVNYQLRVSPLKDWVGGIIIPTLDESYRGFTVRIFDRQASSRWMRSTDRHYNSPGFTRVNTIYNFQRAKIARVIQLCEGVFSAISAGLNAIATYGKDVSAQQFERIVSCKAEEYVVAFDGDLESRPCRHFLASMLYDFGKKVSVVELPSDKDHKDPNSVDDYQYYYKNRIPVDRWWLMRESLQMLDAS